MKIKARCEIRRNDLLGKVRVKFSCDEPAKFTARMGRDVWLDLCTEHALDFHAAHPKIVVDKRK